ncbi:nitric oxide dioxygenase [Scopulibacillus daqui]|uniref:Flavohemoprotein n=1 Tax=Scopulibacillus daqui TaxID=1469162 RepID=A0ABS2Q0L0_9BACL|nr:NO-inducible flavohemoprotein [Scopulibacillus daqui]MBM7645841.1 nitric oxide dioxygenase [Scopulibacillus daqui]
MDQKTIDIIKATVPVLEEKGNEITKAFYKHLFSEHPELNHVFNQTHQKEGKQPRALAKLVYQAAAHIDRLEELLPAVKVVAHKHRSIGIKPEQYPIVGEHLLWAIKHVLGDQATDEIMKAWETAYGVIADAFIQLENELREDVKENNGWNDYMPFIIDKKVKESDVITSFYLKPANGQALPEYLPGQYISLKLNIPGEAYTHIRQYSLSDAPGKNYFRISVKREDEKAMYPEGVVSHYLHESMKEGDRMFVSAPAGDFTLDMSSYQPLVFISGGVGQTPLMSMLKTVIEKQPERPITWIHAAKNGNCHAFKEEVKKAAKKHKNLKTFICYNDPSSDDLEKKDIKKVGYIDEQWLSEIIEYRHASYYFCGPKPFMAAIYKILKQWEINDTDIHYEFFGPQDELLEEQAITV